MKVYPHDEVLRIVSKGHRSVLDKLITQSIIDSKTYFVADDAMRERYALALGCSEKSVANALSSLATPAYRQGPEILVRLTIGKYMLNPAYYFIGNEEKRSAALEYVAALRRAGKKKWEIRRKQPSRARATVTRLQAVTNHN